MIGLEYQYNQLILNDSAGLYVMSEIQGLDNAASEDVRESRPAMHGQIDYAHLLRERLITFMGNILPKTIIERKITRYNFLDNFKNDGSYYWLKWQQTGEVAKQVYCKVLNRSISDRVGQGPFIREFLVNLIAIDPRIYSQEEITKTVYIPSTEGGRIFPKTYPKTYGTIQVGGKIVCTNDGNFSMLPIVKMYGPLSNPKIRNNDDDAKEILINMEVADGEYLEIDFEEKTIMLNGTTSRYNYLDNDSKWWEIKTGNNEIEFRDGLGNVNGKAEIIFRHSWI